MSQTDSNVFRVTGWNKDYITADHGKGIYLFDSEGKQYLDAIGGTHVSSIGYGVEAIAEAMAEQSNKVNFVHKALFTSQAQEDLATNIAEMAPEGMSRVSFATGGSTANEMAIQMAQYYQMEKDRPHRRKTIARWHSYHGRTIATLSLSGNMFVRRNMPITQMDFPHIQAPSCYQCPYKKTFPECNLQCAEELKTCIEQEGPDSVSSFIAEPIIGGAGSAIVPPPGYYERIREICDEYDILFISEEVITSFGRTGKNFGIEHWGATPDIITSAKALSSGYAPIAALIVHDKISDTLMSGKRAGIPVFTTYSGHPISCAAALAVQHYIAEHDLINQCASRGVYLKSRLQQLAAREPLIGDVRGEGLMLGLEFVADLETHKPFPRSTQLVGNLVKTALDNGLIIRGQPGTGTEANGDHIMLSPPFIISESECDDIVMLLEKSIQQVKAELQLGISV